MSNGKPKTVASIFSLAKKIAAGLKKAGISNFSASVSVKDLGVDFAGGRRRTVLVRNSRLKKSAGPPEGDQGYGPNKLHGQEIGDHRCDAAGLVGLVCHGATDE